MANGMHRIKIIRDADTGHFLNVIMQLNTIPPDSLLVTMDVNSLYTSISNEKGITAAKSLLESSTLSTNLVQLCLDLLRLVSYENFFLYEDTYYIQQQGTAMGSNVAPAYANAYMNAFELNFVYTDDRFKQHIQCYHRCIDNIFFIWAGPTETLVTFHETLNGIYLELQFTMHYDSKQISFLDTLICKNNQGHLSTDLYSKPTDCNSLLHYFSSHPKATRNSLPRSQFTRVSKIVSDPDILPMYVDTLSQHSISLRMACFTCMESSFDRMFTSQQHLPNARTTPQINSRPFICLIENDIMKGLPTPVHEIALESIVQLLMVPLKTE
ncbi:unnamed protein product [Ranitomeya imitator]|uniref:Reverse transcriptase domain-containing protein n=1 Tax=Ranitomeya imitator TaxID=111125 RepID=A0ABN9LDJ3_9NEOB|nr:unnamed protein product [Ranitomeya imitator]